MRIKKVCLILVLFLLFAFSFTTINAGATGAYLTQNGNILLIVSFSQVGSHLPDRWGDNMTQVVFFKVNETTYQVGSDYYVVTGKGMLKNKGMLVAKKVDSI
ncbi:hypothetical protein ACFL56_00475 [Candidatus Margulisiibacteriota bacterium]